MIVNSDSWQQDYEVTLNAVLAVLHMRRDQFETSKMAQKLVPILSHTAQDGVRNGGNRTDPMHEVFSLIGDKWSSLILQLLGASNFRHTVLRKLVCVVGADNRISQRVLTSLLRTMERDGLVQRTALQTIPPGVEYSLTPFGRDLLTELEGLMTWVHRHGDRIKQARARFDAEAQPGLACGESSPSYNCVERDSYSLT